MTQDAVLVTGAAGFIGFHVAQRLLQQGRAVVGLDNMNAYYDPALKEARLAVLKNHETFEFEKVDLADRDNLFDAVRAAAVLARDPSRRAGRRALLDRSSARLCQCESGWLSQYARSLPAPRLRASALCVVLFGLRRQHEGAVCDRGQCRSPGQPLRGDQEGERADGACLQPSLPVALHGTALLHRLRRRGAGRTWRCICLPMRSPRDRPIKIFNNGDMRRDFTYVDDVSEAVVRLMDHVPQAGGADSNPGTSAAPWRVYNIGNNRRKS